jgi:hypothetical protein
MFLFSLRGRARTHAAHWASLGNFAPGGSVLKCAGDVELDAPVVLAGCGDGLADGFADVEGFVDALGPT